MWILIKHRLPTRPSPPLYSIHFAGASAEDVTLVHKQKNLAQVAGEMSRHGYREDFIDLGDRYLDAFGYEPKEEGAVWILFDNEPIKVLPHEYSPISGDHLSNYILGLDDAEDDYTMSHVPMYGRQPLFCDPKTMRAEPVFEQHPRFNRDTFEAALVDGQSELLAFYTALGVHDFPKDLWFSLVRAYGDHFGLNDDDMTPIYNNKPEDAIKDLIISGWKED